MGRTAEDYDTRTKTSRLRLKAREKPYFRQISPGLTLGYIRRPDAAGSWQLRTLEGGRYKYRTLGQADDLAPADGRDVLAFDQALRLATNPTVADRPGKMTVAVALDRYFTTLAGKSKHAEAYRAVAKRHIEPTLGGHRIDRLTKSQIESWQSSLVRDDPADEEVRRRSQDTANRVLTHLKAALNLAFADDANGIATDAAWRRVKPFHDVSRGRDDDLDPKQVRLLIAKAATFDGALARLLEAAYLTGARLGELVAARVRDLDTKGLTLKVDGKTGKRTISLTDESAQFLGRVAEGRNRDAPLLPRSDGERWSEHQHHRGVKRAVKLAEQPDTVCIYTLRHAHISRAIEAGMPLSLIAENCGTSLTMIQKSYAHVLARTRSDVIQKTAPKLRRIK